jgi:hypothetical protein
MKNSRSRSRPHLKNPLIENKFLLSIFSIQHISRSRFFLQNIVLLLSLSCAKANEVETDSENPPEGYYAFIQSASAFPPTVRPPPYQPVKADCPDYLNQKPYVSPNNLCGDLNRGKIPRNPMQQNVMGEIYPL